jgi:hypothetical protein
MVPRICDETAALRAPLGIGDRVAQVYGFDLYSWIYQSLTRFGMRREPAQTIPFTLGEDSPFDS